MPIRRESPHAMIQPVPQYLRDHAQHLGKRSIFLADCTMRYGSSEGLTLLSLIATAGRVGYEGLLEEARALVAAGSADGLPPIDLVTLAYVARVKGGRPGPGLDFTEAADLCQAVRVLRAGRRLKPGQGLPGDADRLDAQTNAAMNRLDYVKRILPRLVLSDESRWMFEAELLNPVHGGGDEDAWIRVFNRIFERSGLMPIALRPGDDAPFDRVVPAWTPRISDTSGPLVSIVMSVFKPDQSLFTALRSLTAQTWPHLQIMVVDDCSPAGYRPLIEQAVALDDRIELHTMPQNGGTYKIRNFAIERAQGDFIAFQDSDDWSHPERIERQLQPLLDDPELVASMSHSVRVYSNLSANKVGYMPLRRNVSSLLLRRDPVMTELGSFDEVRKSADSEFLERMELHYDDHRILTLELPLALVQLTSNSLSRTDFQFGWRDGNRVAYRQAFEYWHGQIARGEEPVRLERGGPRRFPAPRALLGGSTSTERHCDVVVVSDWRGANERYAGANDEVGALVRAGKSTELLHAETMRYAVRPRLAPSDETMQMQADGVASFARWEEPLRARLAVVRDPELLCYPRRSDTLAVRADRVLIQAGYPTRAPGTGAFVYDPVIVENNARAMFGGAAIWQPANAQVAASLKADGATAVVLEPAHLAVVPVRRRGYEGMRGVNRPILGTTGLEGSGKDRPSLARLVELLPDDDRYDVRIRDLAGALDRLPIHEVPANWLVSRSALGPFLEQLDLFVGFPHTTWGPELSHAAAAAIAHGCVAVLDPAYRPQFGPAALYTSDGSVRQIIDRLRDDPAMFSAQQQAGYQWCENALSPHAFVDALEAASGTPSVEREKARP
jgi:hypothetical protein